MAEQQTGFLFLNKIHLVGGGVCGSSASNAFFGVNPCDFPQKWQDTARNEDCVLGH
jgi:hypothetical protein